MKNMGRAVTYFRFILVIAGALFALTPAAAQDAVPETSDGIEGFRLDSPVPAPAPGPEPEPTTLPPATPPVGAPPTTRETPNAPVPSTALPSGPAPQLLPQQPARPSTERPTAQPSSAASATETPSPTSSPAQDTNETDTSDSAAADITDETVVPTDTESVPTTETKEATASEETTEPNGAPSSPEWPILAAIIAGLLILIGGFIFINRRRRAAQAATIPAETATNNIQIADEPATNGKADPVLTIKDAELPPEPEMAVPTARSREKPVDETEKSASKTETKEETAPGKPRARPELEMRFIPESAMLSFANLTLRGELKIANIGKAMARKVQLCSGAICASDNHNEEIVAFFGSVGAQDYQSIDNIRKGERLSVSLEITLPREELKSYTVQGRLICVPIMLAEIRYSGLHEGSEQSMRISAMVGPEATPPSDKIGALRLDLGPRSFSPLGQRPIDA